MRRHKIKFTCDKIDELHSKMNVEIINEGGMILPEIMVYVN
jgi:hypothetical protein